MFNLEGRIKDFFELNFSLQIIRRGTGDLETGTPVSASRHLTSAATILLCKQREQLAGSLQVLGGIVSFCPFCP